MIDYIRNFNEEASNIFGFIAPKEPKFQQQDDPDELPVKSFGSEKMLKALSQLKISGFPGKYLYTNEVRWGNGSGAVRVIVSPNFTIMVERRTENLMGDPVWVCDATYKIRTDEFAGEEMSVAADLSDVVEKISVKPVPAAQETFKVERLANRLIDMVKAYTEGIFVYSQTKKHDDNWFTLMFDLKGAGVGQLVRQTKAGETALGIIELVFYPSLGEIKCILTTIGIEGESEAWETFVPYFTAKFVPTQKIEKISSIIFTGLKSI